jgi:hypothetical protein
LLYEHGGIWMDASILLFRSLPELLPAEALSGPDPFAFFNRMWSTDFERPMIESWFISSPPGHPLIERWLREYRMACLSRKTYIAAAKLIHGQDRIFQNYPPTRYFTIFAALQRVMLLNESYRFLISDSELGPYRLPGRTGYDPEKIAQALIEGPLPDVHWLKLSRKSRNAVISGIARGRLSPESPLFEFIPSPVATSRTG